MRHGALALLAALLLLACGPPPADARAQWKVVVSTDAPVPQFGDRVIAEILDEQGQLACDGCRRQFGVTPDHFPLSFGVQAPGNGKRYRLNVQLYRTIDTGGDGLPGSDRRIDALVELPSTDSLQEVSVELRMSCFGRLSDRTANLSCDPEAGTLAPVAYAPKTETSVALPAVGSWAPSTEVACAKPAPADMTCIPGGVFLLGDPRRPFGFVSDTQPEQLVQLSPFALDTDELTVGKLRELVIAGGIPQPVAHDAASDAKYCNWLGTSDPSNDALPVNCASWAVARQACVTQGKRLPTEAEWEFAAGNRARETRFPWGTTDDESSIEKICAHALVAHAHVDDPESSAVCRGSGSPAGLVPGGSPDDQTELGVRNMAGSVAEWVADAYEPYAETCWPKEVNLLVDPICDSAERVSLRGGDWSAVPAKAVVNVREAVFDGEPWWNTGIRCAMSL